MCLLPSLHTCQLSDSHQTFPNSKDTQAKYIILMDGFISSRALEPLNSALESFTMVCNLLIGMYESSLRGETEGANSACWRHGSWILLLVASASSRWEEVYPTFPSQGSLLGCPGVKCQHRPNSYHLWSSTSALWPKCGHLSQLLVMALATAHPEHIHCWEIRWEGEVTAGRAGVSVTTAGQQGPIPTGNWGGGRMGCPGSIHHCRWQHQTWQEP